MEMLVACSLCWASGGAPHTQLLCLCALCPVPCLQRALSRRGMPTLAIASCWVWLGSSWTSSAYCMC